jgi:hypothetical protein
LSGWQDVYQDLADDDFVLIAAAQDTGGEAVAREWYDKAGATYVTLVDETHTISALYGLVNVPSAVWIDESGTIRRIDEGTYATTHKMGEFEFGRADYAPMLVDWVTQGNKSEHVQAAVSPDSWNAVDQDAARADPAFKLGVYFHKQGDEVKANHYWETAQALDPRSWNYARQDWSFTPEEAGPNFQKKVETMDGRPFYQPIEGLDSGAR